MARDETRDVPHDAFVALESENAELRKRLSGTETERDFWRKKHQDDNEGLMFQLGRNLEFAQAAAFRHGATEPHPTIKCIQIIDGHAESLRRQLADRDTENAELRKRVEQQADAINSALTMLRCGGDCEDAQSLLDVINSAIACLEPKP